MVKKMSEPMKNSLLTLAIVLAGILVLNFIGQNAYFKIDLTEEKRFTLSDETIRLLESLDEELLISVLLDGDLSAEYKRLQNSAIDMLDQFRSFAPLIEYKLEDPSLGSIEQVNQNKEGLKERGVLPVNDLRTQKLLYPHAIFMLGGRGIAVNMQEHQIQGVDNEEIINNSISLLEYKFANAIHKLKQKEKQVIRIIEGHRELFPTQTVSLERMLQKYYDIERIDLEEAQLIEDDTDLIIVAKPRETYTDAELFKIDQYVMNGGRAIFLIDHLNASLDSISKYGQFIPSLHGHGLDELFFNFGVRINNDLVADLSCSRIPQVIGSAGGKSQTEMFNWLYHPVVVPDSKHPIVNNIGPVNLDFPSSIDTLRGKGNVTKTILLRSSEYSRIQSQPIQLDFDILQFEPEPDKFRQGNQILSVLLEGEFESSFNNRLTSDLQVLLDQSSKQFANSTTEGKVIIVSDGDLIKNLYNNSTKNFAPIGYNQWENYVFEGNEKFILNTIDYLLDDLGLLNARTKEVKLRLLNTTKIAEEKAKWQLINLLGPLLFLFLFGVVFFLIRKSKYSKN
jgi:gliding-associated putative ABC transporter substrate-binding component GldG